MNKNKALTKQRRGKRLGRPKGSKNRFRRDTSMAMRDVIVGLEELEVGRARLRMASAAWSAPKTIIALAAIRLRAKELVRVLDPLFS